MKAASRLTSLLCLPLRNRIHLFYWCTSNTVGHYLQGLVGILFPVGENPTYNEVVSHSPSYHLTTGTTDMVISQRKKGDPAIDPKYYNPFYGDPQKRTPNFGNHPYHEFFLDNHLGFVWLGHAISTAFRSLIDQARSLVYGFSRHGLPTKLPPRIFKGFIGNPKQGTPRIM